MDEASSQDATALLIRSLPKLPKTRLVELWKDNFGREPGRIRPELMLPILAYRIQERAYGGLSPKTSARSQVIATSLRPQSRSRDEARQRFKSGTKLVREWRGTTHEVTLNDAGYRYLGKTYKSLSPIACEITGTRWSGPAFFGTKKVKAS
ncbi:DUF2924 domain-containing protein [Tunturiibacter gelidoferens]|uniref:DUF2924 domain-containing protein n=1 Tax=Tunturiibacter lichenicola TaxID=2051959 RepID=A0A7Y9NQ88_9BACT|nr:DUF2924 domain-containing protein [Edaphobacter lichenicola]NYF53560.1 hypothetical protein [Edaphobacter lichenicola]